MQAYTDRFEYLASFFSPTVTEEWRCRKYEGRLKHELRRFIVPLRIREFLVLVELAKAVKQLEMGPSRGARPQKNTSDSWQQEKSYDRPQSSVKKLQCYNYGGKHLRRDCPKPSGSSSGGSSIGKCYVCDQMGHFARHGPNKKSARGAPAKKPVGDRPRAPGRVFALTTIKVA